MLHLVKLSVTTESISQPNSIKHFAFNICIFLLCVRRNRPQPSPRGWKPSNLVMQSSHLSHSPAHDSNLIWALAGNSTVLPVYQRSAVSVKQQKKREGAKEKKRRERNTRRLPNMNRRMRFMVRWRRRGWRREKKKTSRGVEFYREQDKDEPWERRETWKHD